MDYKEKYEQAISRMNKWVEGSEITDPKEVAEFVFPELKEREIGRIKTNIIKLLRFVRDTNHQYSDECNEAIDWLEKQKDAKKEYWIGYIEGKKEILEQCSKSSDSKNEMIRKAIFKALSKKDARDVLLAKGVQVSDALTWLEKQGEQKPVEWSEEDERMCQETIDWFEKKCFPYALESQNPARESIKWLKSLKDRIQPQSNIEKLKNEINKRIKKLEPVHPHFAPFVTGQRSAFKDCLNFIDSLQSETDKR